MPGSATLCRECKRQKKRQKRGRGSRSSIQYTIHSIQYTVYKPFHSISHLLTILLPSLSYFFSCCISLHLYPSIAASHNPEPNPPTRPDQTYPQCVCSSPLFSSSAPLQHLLSLYVPFPSYPYPSPQLPAASAPSATPATPATHALTHPSQPNSAIAYATARGTTSWRRVSRHLRPATRSTGSGRTPWTANGAS